MKKIITRETESDLICSEITLDRMKKIIPVKMNAEIIYFSIELRRAGEFSKNDPGRVLYQTSIKFVKLVVVKKLFKGTPRIDATGFFSRPNPVSIKILVYKCGIKIIKQVRLNFNNDFTRIPVKFSESNMYRIESMTNDMLS